ncbi:MAG: hypothetical protein RSB38_07340, partial [Oscillospiraceae bacterium]
TDNMRHPVISNIQETRKNTVTVVSAQDMTNFTADKFEYWDKTRTKDIFLSKDAKYVYNNRVETSFKDDFSKIEDGTISLKDNNGDKKIDYVFIDNSVDYVVENLANNGNIKVKYLVESGNTSEIKYSNITLKIDEENACSIESVDGTEVQYKDIKKGDVISVFTNNTDDFIRVVVGKNEKFEGSVTAKKQDGNITINDEAYYVSNLAVFNTLLVGQSYEFYQKFNGNIIYAEKKVQAESAWKYGYILGMTKEKDGTYRVLVVDSGKIENREEVDESDKTNANKIPVTLCGNKAVTEYVVADKLTIDGSTGKSVNIENQIHKPLRYATDAKGDLKKIETITFVGGGSGMKYNAKEKVFGGIRILDPFMIDEKTNVICLPSSGSTSTDDLLTRIYIDNKDTLLRYNTQGYEIVDETGAVELFVITAEMDATSTKGVYQNSSKMGLVSEAAMCLNDENEEYMSITMITGKEVKSIETLPLTDRRKDLRELKNGDFIFYSEDADGKIDNVIIAKNVLDIENSYHTGQYSLNEQMAGYVTDIRLNKIDNLSLQKVNEVDVLIEVNETVKLPITNNPDIFIYNKNTDTVEAGTIDDIVPYSEITENSERVLVVMPNATVRALVIIR